MNWKEWFTTLGGFGSQKMEEVGFLPFLTLMVISLLCSLLIAYLYSKFYQSRATGSQVHRAFPLLGISITAIFICIQFSLPLSLGLLGALSIVRFRTPIKEPEEIGFVMLVIASSICCATFNFLFLGILLIVAVMALFILRGSQRLMKGRLNDGMLILTLPTSEYQTHSGELLNFLDTMLPKGRIDSIAENKEESIVSYSFIRIDKNKLIDIQNQLKNITAKVKSNTFFNRSGEV